MRDGNTIVACPDCGAKNRVPKDRWRERPKCGKCKIPLDLPLLYPDSPVNIDDSSFEEEVMRFPGTVLVDFTAPW